MGQTVKLNVVESVIITIMMGITMPLLRA
uniref:Uncharacterized protein n=1 Tax=Tetranychus urticae TaxID=32264 RepID=T1JRF2_TETUR